jgi:hypothetical protein
VRVVFRVVVSDVHDNVYAGVLVTLCTVRGGGGDPPSSLDASCRQLSAAAAAVLTPPCAAASPSPRALLFLFHY